MKKPFIILIVILFIPCILVVFVSRTRNLKIENTVVFKPLLSQYNLFQGKLSALQPNKQAEIYEIASELFSDYAIKQRLLYLPLNKKLSSKDSSGLPHFPEGTIIAKTFFFPTVKEKESDTVPIETRLLIKNGNQWNAATYQWNKSQEEAYLVKDEVKVPLTITNSLAQSKKINYQIPSQAACIACHRHQNKVHPIGPTLKNLNINVIKEGTKINQLDYLKTKDLFESANTFSAAKMVDYTNENMPLDKRARAYLDINCAHCHHPTGSADLTQLDLRYETPIRKTGIWLKQAKIAYRMTVPGELHMPKLGTSIPDKEGIALILEYLENL